MSTAWTNLNKLILYRTQFRTVIWWDNLSFTNLLRLINFLTLSFIKYKFFIFFQLHQRNYDDHESHEIFRYETLRKSFHKCLYILSSDFIKKLILARTIIHAYNATNLNKLIQNL